MSRLALTHRERLSLWEAKNLSLRWTHLYLVIGLIWSLLIKKAIVRRRLSLNLFFRDGRSLI
jgi:hypothetical protein